MSQPLLDLPFPALERLLGSISAREFFDRFWEKAPGLLNPRTSAERADFLRAKPASGPGLRTAMTPWFYSRAQTKTECSAEVAVYKFGDAAKGVLEADSARQARSLLRDQGLTPYRVDVIAACCIPGDVMQTGAVSIVRAVCVFAARVQDADGAEAVTACEVEIVPVRIGVAEIVDWA